ncbi:6-phosphogluconolactonase [Oleomonas cavernae]|uniref:6-phosphogluconolactonase n=2 Tax=Oleomonas cavernae TaxID=2320859 RepID=A0A418WHA7_9PROT|nr:6-phosphogluconolactonase [Oleomonas cavernae]
MVQPPLRVFGDGAMLAAALAQFVAAALAARIARDGAAMLAVSGGRTPVRFFEALAQAPLNWSAVTVTLVDDRWVTQSDARSNARLVRTHLLQGPAGIARFVPLVSADAAPEQALAAIERNLGALDWPLAAAVLGMGDEGHTASFFPAGDYLAQALDPAGKARVVAMRAPGAAEPRVTLALPVLAAAEHLALHIEGTAKRSVLDEALAPGPDIDMPVRAVLRMARPPTVFWCP